MTTTSSISSEYQLVQAAESSAKTSASSYASSSAATGTGSSSVSSLASLADNYNTFLTLLTTQLQNQDPSSPMSSDTFTQELAQFAGVEQQVQTNTNLSTLISLNEESQLNSDASLVGKTATADSTTLPLQNGSASLSFTGTAGETVAIAVANSSGTVVKDVVATADSGTNTWTWDGTDNSGNQLTDGAYSVAVETINSSGTTSAVPFTVSGTITGVTKGSTDMEAEMGSADIPMADITATSSSTSSTSTSSSGSSTGS
ncbi:flagellar hook capping protein [Gluconacetobacter diazotrophicus PA1 5]|uniref:Basal-body rod modification protein FlgD n=2 Tax=Gluconacetobacter diazotrophicus TaxID=33996 RepID=A9HHB6_GLUDA|nr:flagellar hook capping FlgD N-terminal domain-containing protein [Gluconacetobacter diazotrophicus]ACI53181.1 flagellar hook capping protein [Gluconacetobacter diazotrophicus PA1 5]MBB2156068.1 flagellar biosynthesis protein FlgD [Gluconacetobacter diazotrophicus]TWB10445.1 flagellar basal-body rod modification protein FlgD [Gluconacetobacter diazotrophicus]CAP55617.1 putative basal-body rod modification protein flgD [Gluconacetobacter diazotrophicus PA1 5]